MNKIKLLIILFLSFLSCKNEIDNKIDFDIKNYINNYFPKYKSDFESLKDFDKWRENKILLYVMETQKNKYEIAIWKNRIMIIKIMINNKMYIYCTYLNDDDINQIKVSINEIKLKDKLYIIPRKNVTKNYSLLYIYNFDDNNSAKRIEYSNYKEHNEIIVFKEFLFEIIKKQKWIYFDENLL